MTLVVALCAVLVGLCIALVGAGIWVLKVSARVERIESVLSQLGPSLASRLVDGVSTKVVLSDRWQDDFAGEEEEAWRS